MKFTKMQGCGNDYVYVNGFEETVANPAELAPRLSDRHFGIGSDGLILILPSEVADCRMQMFNADGSEAEMCGNGVRCVAKYAFDHGLTTKTELAVETGAGVKHLALTVDQGRVTQVRVNMGTPRLERSEIPMLGPAGRVVSEPLEVDGRAVAITAVSMGNPHAVVRIEGHPADFPVTELGPKLETHPVFPARANIEFVQIVSRGEIRQRTWERGAGETLACGTGASAVAVACALNGWTERQVLIHLTGGDLEIDWANDGQVYMTGPAVEVFSGEIAL
jgi:diaminopimelate epimerase